MKEKDVNKKGCGPVLLIGCLTPIVIIAVILIIAAIGDATNNNKKKDAAITVSDTTLPVEKRVESAAISAVGEKTSRDKSRNIKVKKDDNILKISLLSDESNTGKSGVSYMLRDTADILEQVQKIKELESIAVIWKDEFVDTYGKESVDDGMRIFISKEELDKINFKNFNSDNLPKIAYNFYLHPAYLK